MNKTITLMLSSYFFISLIFPSYASSPEKDESSWLFKAVCYPVTLALDVVSIPLHKLATNNPPSESVESFKEAMQSMSDKNFSKAAEDLERSATLGNPEAMYHMGLLMLMLPEKDFDLLKHIVPYDSKMGIAYLKNAQEKKYHKANEILSYYNDIVEATRVYTIAYGLDGKEPNVELARKSLKRLIKKGNPVAKYFYADALLGNGCLIHPWILEQEISLLERRKKALPLLCDAHAKKMPTAVKLMTELEREDALYGIICGMILQNSNSKIAGLCLGDAGYQEAYIDYLVKKGIKIHGYTLSPELGLFMKTVMEHRVSQLFHFFSAYFTYLSNLDARLINNDGATINKSLLLENMKTEVVGKYVCVLDKLGAQPHLVDITFDFREGGLLHPITEHDSCRAYAKLFEAADDFSDVEPEKRAVIPDVQDSDLIYPIIEHGTARVYTVIPEDASSFSDVSNARKM